MQNSRSPPQEAEAQPVALTRAERGARSRELILKAAIDLFGERGFQAVALDEVSARSGANRQLLLYYFKNKEELWRAAASEVVSDFHAVLDPKLASVASGDSEAVVRARLAVWLDAFLDKPDFARFLVREGGVRSPRLDFLVRHFYGDQSSHLSRDARERFQATILPDALVATFVAMAALGPLMDTFLAHATSRPTAGIYPMSRENRRVLVDSMTRLIRSEIGDDAGEMGE